MRGLRETALVGQGVSNDSMIFNHLIRIINSLGDVTMMSLLLGAGALGLTWRGGLKDGFCFGVNDDCWRVIKSLF